MTKLWHDLGFEGFPNNNLVFAFLEDISLEEPSKLNKNINACGFEMDNDECLKLLGKLPIFVFILENLLSFEVT